jgi:TM2 domain-containing membrane protein YozV
MPKSKITAALLCWFLGCFGVHRFYLGYTTIGIVQLLTCGGCGIWVIVDFIMILTGNLKDIQGRDLTS